MRLDVSPEDLLRALVGMCYMHDQPGWQNSVLRLVDVFVDGLCVQAGADKPRGGNGASRRRQARCEERSSAAGCSQESQVNIGRWRAVDEQGMQTGCAA